MFALIARVMDVEKRLEWLEETDKQRNAAMKANPVASKAEDDALCEKLKNVENWSNHNNLHFVGISDTAGFIIWLLKMNSRDDTTKLPETE